MGAHRLDREPRVAVAGAERGLEPVALLVVTIGFIDCPVGPPSTRQAVTSVAPFQLAHSLAVPSVPLAAASAGVVGGCAFHGKR